jgi:hypothetical protein
MGVFLAAADVHDVVQHSKMVSIDAWVETCADDFGANLYLECITNSTTYPDGDWVHTLRSGGKSLSLTNLDALRASGVQVPNDPKFTGWRYEPDIACMQACADELDTKCRMFTYDGISSDRFEPSPQ